MVEDSFKDSERHEIIAEVNDRRLKVAFWTSGTRKNKPVRKSQAGRRTSGSGTGEVVAPMQGTIVSFLVEVGSKVDAGDPVCVLEAMKMENHVIAEKPGTIQKIYVNQGDSVGVGDVLASIE